MAYMHLMFSVIYSKVAACFYALAAVMLAALHTSSCVDCALSNSAVNTIVHLEERSVVCYSLRILLHALLGILLQCHNEKAEMH